MKKRLIKLLILSIFIFSGYINNSYTQQRDYNFDVSVTINPSEIELWIEDSNGDKVNNVEFYHGQITNGETLKQNEVTKTLYVKTNLQSTVYVDMGFKDSTFSSNFGQGSNLIAQYSLKAKENSYSTLEKDIPFNGEKGLEFSLKSELTTTNGQPVSSPIGDISSGDITLNVIFKKVAY